MSPRGLTRSARQNQSIIDRGKPVAVSPIESTSTPPRRTVDRRSSTVLPEKAASFRVGGGSPVAERIPVAAEEPRMGEAVSREISQASAVYRGGRSKSRGAYRGVRAETIAETEAVRDRERRGAVDGLTVARVDPVPGVTRVAAQVPASRVSDGGPRKVARIAHFEVDRQHRHGPSCGHHFYKNRWHDFSRSHLHGPGCGHHYRNGLWLSFSIGHTHGRGCGHFLDGGRWLSHSPIHRHGTGCGHYYHGGLWHNYPQYHRHFDGCGHYRHGSVWLDFPITHRHSSTCGHLYDGVGWYVHGSLSHTHGVGCGHFYYRGRWNLYPRSYYTRYRSSGFYFFIDLGDYRSRNLPERVYDEYIYEEHEPIDVYEEADPVSRAYAAFASGRFYESLVAFNDAIELDPENGILYLARAQAQVAIRDYRSAYDDLVRGIDLVPEWSEVDFNIAELYNDPAWFGEHFDALNEWVADYPRDYKAHFVLGYIHYFEKDYAAAKSEFIYTLAWDENHEQAQSMLDSIFSMEAELEVEALATEEDGGSTLEEDPES